MFATEMTPNASALHTAVACSYGRSQSQISFLFGDGRREIINPGLTIAALVAPAFVFLLSQITTFKWPSFAAPSIASCNDTVGLRMHGKEEGKIMKAQE